MLIDIRPATLILLHLSLFFVLLVLRSYIMLVIIMLLSATQSIWILTHWRLNLVLAIQIVLSEGCLTLNEAITHDR